VGDLPDCGIAVLHRPSESTGELVAMISRIWIFACIALGQGLGFLTLTPPDEAFDNLRKWWALLSRASGIVGAE
jgi:hypothetical protein